MNELIDRLIDLAFAEDIGDIYDLETGMWREGPSGILEAYKQHPEKEF